MKKILTVLLLLTSGPVFALSLAGVKLDDTVNVGGETLQLNGAGIRTKFVFDIYVAAFYTAEPVRKVSELVVKDQPMRMAMHFVYDEVSKEKLVDAWNDGFEDNLSEKEFKALRTRIDLFNRLFETVKAGDVIQLDYIPGKGTFVIINNNNKGSVTGAKFFRALLMIWLGEDPVGDDLKEALLGHIESDEE